MSLKMAGSNRSVRRRSARYWEFNATFRSVSQRMVARPLARCAESAPVAADPDGQ
jgi:hypothetical protein